MTYAVRMGLRWLLFFNLVRGINQNHASLFSEDSTQGMEEQGTEQESSENSKDNSFVWISHIEAVSELTRLDFDKTQAMPAYNFLSYLVYVDFKRRKEKQELEQIRIKNKLI